MTTQSPTSDSLLIGELNSLPLFVASDASALDIIESDPEMTMYYIIASHDVVVNSGSQNIKKEHATLYLIKKNLLVRTVSLVEGKELTLKASLPTSDVQLLLPKIPYTLRQKLDAFFRKVDKLHGTESIVILTYDPYFLDKEVPSDGWGCLAPKQENTSAHCNYDPTSIMKDKPASVFVVGSVHSHPNMPAYFSSTDHQDQTDWDGIHITYGWQSTVNKGETQYHIEINASGKSFSCEPSDIFEDPLPPTVQTDEIDEWIQNVSKKTFQNQGNFPSGGKSNTTGQGTSSSGFIGGTFVPTAKTKAINLPENAPLPTVTTIIGVIDTSTATKKCPFCATPLIPQAISVNLCYACHCFVVLPGTSLQALCDNRTNLNFYDINIDPSKAPKPIVFWSQNDSGEHIFSEDLRDSDLVTDPK